MPRVGSDGYEFEVVPSWPNMPRYWTFPTVSKGAVNSKGEIFVFSRSNHAITVWDTDGNFITSWGEGLFNFPHGIYILPNDNLWLVDAFDHVATQHTPDGTIVKSLGEKGVPTASFLGKPFNMPTGLALAPNGEMFVSDGYGGHRVHRFSADGELLQSWGREGTGPGEFVNVHNVTVDADGRVYICDRENNRIQLFDADGNFLTEWTDLKRPNDIAIQNNVAHVSEAGDGSGRRTSLWTLDGDIITRWSSNEGPLKGVSYGSHGIFLDKQGSIYTCGNGVTKFQYV